MATGNPYRRQTQGLQDFTAGLPPGSPSADPGMVAQPYADPGYGMPNVFVGNLNQAPGQTVGGYLPANALQAAPGNVGAGGNPLLQGTASQPSDPLSLWLAQQRQKRPYDDLIMQVMNLPRGQADPNVPLWPYPPSTARVPSYSMSDSPYPSYVNPGVTPDPGAFDQRIVTRNPNLDSNQMQRTMAGIHNLPDDLAAMIYGMENRRKLGRNQ